MFAVCDRCGLYAEDQAVENGADGSYAVCPHCGYRRPFLRLPLFIVTGASAAGKSALCRVLPRTLPECVTLEMDVLLRPEFVHVEDGWRTYFTNWLRLAGPIHQSGRPMVLGQTILPEQLEDLLLRPYFTAIHDLGLVCDDALLADRLRARPSWCRSGTPEFIDEMLRFNRRLKEQGGMMTPPVSLLYTDGQSVEETAAAVADWVRRRLP